MTKLIFFTPSSEVVANEDFLEKRYGNSISIVGTRENNFFKPLDKRKILVKKGSISEKYFTATVDSRTREVVNIIPEKFYAVIYDYKWWIGKVLDTCEEERDAKIQFMHPPRPSTIL